MLVPLKFIRLILLLRMKSILIKLNLLGTIINTSGCYFGYKFSKTSSDLNFSSKGKQKARVLPDPVLSYPMTSLSSKIGL